MKPSPLIKIFVSGLMASAFLLTAACDNASRRGVKALYDPKAQSLQKVTDADSECIKDIAEAIDEHSTAIKSINDSLTASLQKPPTQAEKDALQVLIQALKPKRDKVIKEIRSARVKDRPILGCYILNETTSKKTTYTIQSLQVDDLVLAKRVKQVTQKTNDLVDEAANNKDLMAQTTVSSNQVYRISNQLADQMGPDSRSGHMYILEGYVNVGEDSQDELSTYKEQKKQSVCSLSASTEKPELDARLKVVSINNRVRSDGKSAESQVVFSGGKDVVYIFECSLAYANDISGQVRAVFGNLIALDVEATANPTPDADPETDSDN